MTEESIDVINQAESLTPEERISEYLDVNLYAWLDRDLRKGLKELIPIENRDYQWKLKMVKLQGNIARVLHVFSETNAANSRSDVSRAWDKKVKDLIFGRNEKDPNAIINCVKGPKQDTTLQLFGPYSILTLVDAIGRANPNMKGSIRPSQIITSPEVDIKGNIDLMFRFGDIGFYGLEILRVAQLKTHTGSDIKVTRVTRENLNNLPLERWYGQRMLETAEKLSGQSELKMEPRAFIIDVPSYLSGAVARNPWGRIERNDIIDKFKQEALDQGFLPKHHANTT